MCAAIPVPSRAAVVATLPASHWSDRVVHAGFTQVAAALTYFCRPVPQEPTGRSGAPGSGGRSLALLATRVASLPQQLAVLLLRHALAALLDDRAHAGSLTFVGLSGFDASNHLDGRTRSKGARHERLPSLPGRSMSPTGRSVPSARVVVGVLQVVVDGLLGHPERFADPHRRQFAGVHQPVHGHL